MLLNHTSGIFNYTDDSTFQQGMGKPWTPIDLVHLATAHAPYFAPGAGWQYSNTNYILLGMIAESAGGAPLATQIRDRDRTPAHLDHTFLDGSETLDGTLAAGFHGTANVTHAIDPTGAWAAGAIVASGADVAEWAAALYGGDAVLGASERDLLTADPADNGSYGLGVIILPASNSLGNGIGLGHDGQIPGFASQMFYFAQTQLALVSIVDDDGGDPNAVSLAALEALQIK
jgi:D-alanyl-D-alanine carboxypeptidase